MRCVMALVSLAAFVVQPAAAQWFGTPAWNSPKGGAGVTINADYGRLDINHDTDPLEATTFGARGSLGLGKATFAVGVSRFDPEGPAEAITVLGAQGAFRVIGGSLIPAAINIQAGVSRHGLIDDPGGPEDITNWLLGVGVGTILPAPGASVEPYLSVSNRWHRFDGNSESNLGFVFGANVAFRTFGLHVAYDYEDDDGGRWGVFGIGAHVTLKSPIGM